MIKGFIAQTILCIEIVLSVVAFFYVNIFYRMGPFLKWLNLLLAIVTIYGLVLFFRGLALYPDEFNMMTSLQFGYLQRIYCSVLPIYAFYLFALKGDLTEENLLQVFLFLFIATVLLFYQSYVKRSSMLEREEITNNIGYRFVPLIPMLALVRLKDVMKYVLMVALFAFIVMSLKRGAILTGAVALLLLMKHQLKTRATKEYKLLLMVAALYAIFMFVTDFYESSDYFKIRISNTLQGNSSGRDSMYLTYFDFFVHRTSALEFLFGCGANATYLRLGQYAHNDWLEFAINQGVLGVVMYTGFWICLVREWHGIRWERVNGYRQVLGDLIIIYFLKSLFSMTFDSLFITASLCIGYCLAQKQRDLSLHIYEH